MAAPEKTKKTRRKTIRKEAVKVILEGAETRITATLGRDNQPRYEIEDKTPNPDKISFGKVSDGRNRLEFASYDKNDKTTAFIFLNGERIMVDKYTGRKMFQLLFKMNHFLGIMGKRKAKN